MKSSDVMGRSDSASAGSECLRFSYTLLGTMGAFVSFGTVSVRCCGVSVATWWCINLWSVLCDVRLQFVKVSVKDPSTLR